MIFYVYLATAILFEVAATTALRFSDGFKYWFPASITAVGYLCSFYFLGLSLQHIPLGVAYAIWSGVGTVLTVGVGFIVFKDSLSWLSAVGIGIVVLGVVCIQLGRPSVGGG